MVFTVEYLYDKEVALQDPEIVGLFLKGQSAECWGCNRKKRDVALGVSMEEA